MENESELISLDANDIKRRIFTIRGKQVMLDSDLAELYGYDVKRLNEQVRRNKERFPEDFMFQLTKVEVNFVKSQFATSQRSDFFAGQEGGRRKLPNVFTEQGIYMLSTVLRGELAVKQSIFIMRAFREMRHFITNNAALFERISSVELRQLEYQKQTDKKFDQLFEFIGEHTETHQKIFFDGQIYDAFSLLIELIQKAEQEIILIDGYVDVSTLNVLAKKQPGVAVTIYTFTKTKLTAQDVAAFNAQYPKLEVKHTNIFHDRFLILDGKTVYHIGASLKDAGKKCFAVSLLQDAKQELLRKLQGI
ncbi:MAG: ORF6N domain-containing protein [Alphaproteobacteria bacterium]|nr:ORF6N domain-containing protein [Alphaproteobacteria bacterium]